MVIFEVEADGFLYNMVRIMVGTLLDMAAKRIDFDAIPAILDSKDRAQAGQTAPAHALCLKEVYYDEREVGQWPTQKKSE
jgi:tRNA pseudouridine38-40 synthase